MACRDALALLKAEGPRPARGRHARPTARKRREGDKEKPLAPEAYRFAPLTVADVSKTAWRLARAKQEEQRASLLETLRQVARGEDARPSPAEGMQAIKPPVPQEVREAAARVLGDLAAKAALRGKTEE